MARNSLDLLAFADWVAFTAEDRAWLQANAVDLVQALVARLQPPAPGDAAIFASWLPEWLQALCSGDYGPAFWEQQIKTGKRLAEANIPLPRWAQWLSELRWKEIPSVLSDIFPAAPASLLPGFSLLLAGCEHVIHEGYLQQQSHQLLLEIRGLTQHFDLEEFFPAAAELACRLAGAQGAGLIVREGEYLHYRLFHGLSTQYQGLASLFFPKEEGVSGAALCQGKVIFERDYANSPYAMPDFVAAGLRGSLALPLPGPEGAQGVLALSWFAESPPQRINELVWEHLLLLADLLGALLYRQSLERKLRHMSTRDVLTGLPNRRVAQDRIRAAMARAQRYERLFCLFFLDLDGFKRVNDTLGHHRGDEVLCQVAERLRAVVREEDSIIRYAGDEFLLVIEDIAHISEMEIIVTRMLAAARLSIAPEQSISASIGVVIYPFDEGGPEEMIRYADQAMYVAKERGGDTWVPYGQYLQETMQEEQQLLRELRLADERHEFRLYWQPIVTLPEQRICGVEALMRWQHPSRGLLAPGAFLEVLEQSVLMDSVAQWIVATAVVEANRWHQGGHLLDIHINLSRRELCSTRWIQWCNEFLHRFPAVRRDHLFFEIVERVAIKDIPTVAKQIRSAQRQLGVQFVLDDFGTGASALQHLGELDCAGIKIDKSMISDLQKGSKHYQLVQGLTYLAENLAIEAVAEGVETAEVAELLPQIGVKKAQGYWFARPGPASAIDTWLEKETCSESAG
ncbi:MAG: EAL domain-containing protein [Candidatus Igneacidithiobacillus chanchocoensis]